MARKESLINLSNNLKRYRNLNNLSQEALAKNSNISRATYANIEGAKEEPKVSTLQLIANALEVDIFKLLEPIPELPSLRYRVKDKLSSKMHNLKEQVKIEFAYWLRNYIHLEEMLGCKKEFKIEISTVPRKDVYKAYKYARKQLGLQEDNGVINDICALVENAGIKVFTFNRDPDCGFGFCINQNDGGPAIAVNINDSITTERKIFTIAHELGHILLHPDSFGVEKDEARDKQEEDEADLFAGLFLMPEKEFEYKYKEAYGMHPVDRILYIKQYFRVSYLTVLKRLSFLTDDSEIYKRFCIAFKNKYNHDLKDHYEPQALGNFDFNEDHLLYLVRKALDRNLITLRAASEILGLSLMKMRELSNEWEMAEKQALEWKT